MANLITWGITKLVPGTIFSILALCHHFSILVHLFLRFHYFKPILSWIEVPLFLPPPPPWAALVKGSLSLGRCSPSCSPDSHPTRRHPWGDKLEIHMLFSQRVGQIGHQVDREDKTPRDDYYSFVL